MSRIADTAQATEANMNSFSRELKQRKVYRVARSRPYTYNPTTTAFVWEYPVRPHIKRPFSYLLRSAQSKRP
jgi:hypothetical protein